MRFAFPLSSNSFDCKFGSFLTSGSLLSKNSVRGKFNLVAGF
jgi:hypothetical protein